jgi:hypothetical protein
MKNLDSPGLDGIPSRIDFEPDGPLGILPAALSVFGLAPPCIVIGNPPARGDCFEGEAEMIEVILERIGNVCYWACSAIAVLFLLVPVVAIFNHASDPVGGFVVMAIYAGLSWTAGRICRYVLAGT